MFKRDREVVNETMEILQRKHNWNRLTNRLVCAALLVMCIVVVRVGRWYAFCRGFVRGVKIGYQEIRRK